MRKIREILRLLWGLRLGVRHVARSCAVGHATVLEYRERAAAAGLSWEQVASMDAVRLERLLFPFVAGPSPRSLPVWSEVHEELKQRGVTLQLLWKESRAVREDEYGYSPFCKLYGEWRGRLDLSMRQEHRAGEKLFVDSSGQTVPVIDPASGEAHAAQIFVAVLGASNYTFAEATWSQKVSDWSGSHVRAFEFFGGVSDRVIPDNLRSGVSKPCRYEPALNTTSHELAQHYGVAVIPARVRRPKDKAKVEVGVQVVERWILACLRRREFFSLRELNAAIGEHLERLNNRRLKKLSGSRRSQFEALDRPALRPLPATPFEDCDWRKVRVRRDYHVEVDGHFYSVPFQLVDRQLEVRLTATGVECLHHEQRVTCHPRSGRRAKRSSTTTSAARNTFKPRHRPRRWPHADPPHARAAARPAARRHGQGARRTAADG